MRHAHGERRAPYRRIGSRGGGRGGDTLLRDRGRDERWRTRWALIEGEANGSPIRFALAADGAGGWARDGLPLPELAGALDVDLGFTPLTNTLPIRRLALAVGESAPVRSAWLRFPELRLEPLQQTYTREAELTFRYHAMVDGDPFIARLDIVRSGGSCGMKVCGRWKTRRRTITRLSQTP